MNIVTYLFGEPKFPVLSPECKLKSTFVDLSTIPLIRRFIKVYRTQVTPSGGYYCDGSKLLSQSVISTLITSEYQRVFMELLRATASAKFEFRIVVPKRLDEFLPNDPELKSTAFTYDAISVVAKRATMFSDELHTYDPWELAIFSRFEAVFPSYTYSTTPDKVNAEEENQLLSQVHRLAKSPLALTGVMSINSLRIEAVRNYTARLYIQYSFIDVYNNPWKILMPGIMRRRDQIAEVIDSIEYEGMSYDDLPPGMSDASLPWGMICVN